MARSSLHVLGGYLNLVKEAWMDGERGEGVALEMSVVHAVGLCL